MTGSHKKPLKTGRKQLYRKGHRTSVLFESQVLAELKRRSRIAKIGTGQYLNRILAESWGLRINVKPPPYTADWIRRKKKRAQSKG